MNEKTATIFGKNEELQDIYNKTLYHASSHLSQNIMRCLCKECRSHSHQNKIEMN
jgi:hypothetical protein